MEGKIVRTWDVSEMLQLRYIEIASDTIIRGVFARIFIPNKTLVEDCPVIPLYASENTARINAVRSYAYNWRMKDENGELIVRYALAMGMGSIYNHAASGNIGNWNYKSEFRMEFWSLRDIKANEELTHDYGWGKYAGTRLNAVDRFLRPIKKSNLRRLGD